MKRQPINEVKRLQKLAGLPAVKLGDENRDNVNEVQWTSTNTNQSLKGGEPGDSLSNDAYVDKLNRDAYFAKEKEKQKASNSFVDLEQAKETARKLSIKDPKAFYIIEKNKNNETFFIIKQQRRHHRFPGVATYKNGLPK